MALFGAFCRRLFTRHDPKPTLCYDCKRGVHVHNMYTNVCIAPDCECGRAVA